MHLRRPLMKILYASVEVAPFAKVGGLADVAGSLPKALAALGHEVKIFMPAYPMVVGSSAPRFKGLTVQLNPNQSYRFDAWELEIDGVPVWLVGGEGLFDETHRSEELYSYGRDHYLFFAQAAMAVCEAAEWIPDVVHANDWHTGFMPVMIREKGGEHWENTASVFSIHNLQYQGGFDQETVAAAGLPEELFTSGKLENWGGVNFIKSACVYADMVNTVSPTYASEITTEAFGVGQWGLMRDLARHGKLRGILNGIDYDAFSPEADPLIAANFSPGDLAGKAQCKHSLQKELGLTVDARLPLIGMVSRLSDQKGYDFILKQAYGMLALGYQFAVLGTGDRWVAGELRELEAEWPDQVRFVERYDGPLAQQIYAGSDMFMIPSRFEPCGLGQMIACRYGTVPIARRTGGLADTIHDGQNGFNFGPIGPKPLFDTVKRAYDAFRDSEGWKQLVVRCMETDFTWKSSAAQYEDMYRDALRARVGVAATV